MNRKNQDIICNNKINIVFLCLKYTENVSVFLTLRKVSLAFKKSANAVYPKLSETIEYINNTYRYNNYAFSKPVTIFERGLLWISQGKIYSYLSGTNNLKGRRVNGTHANIFKESSKFLKNNFFLENIDLLQQQKDWKNNLAKKMEDPSLSKEDRFQFLPAEGDLLLWKAKAYARVLIIIFVCVIFIGAFFL